MHSVRLRSGHFEKHNFTLLITYMCVYVCGFRSQKNGLCCLLGTGLKPLVRAVVGLKAENVCQVYTVQGPRNKAHSASRLQR